METGNTMSTGQTVIEAEDMYAHNFTTVHGDQASGGELVKISSSSGSLSTNFGGDSGTYDLTLNIQDENDGESTLWIYVDGAFVGEITLDNNNDGGGSNNGGFSAFTLEGIEVPAGACIQICAAQNCGEYVRIDNMVLTPVVEPDTTTVCLLEENFDGHWNSVASSDFYGSHGYAVTDGNDDGRIKFDSVDLTGYDSATISLDAKIWEGHFEEWGEQYGDMVKIIVKDQDGNSHVLDMFSGSGQHLVGSKTGQVIDASLDTLTYTIPDGIEVAQLIIKSDISADCERIKFDNVKIEGHKTTEPDPDPECIYVIEAEDMHLSGGFSIEHGSQASNGELVRLDNGNDGKLTTTFEGDAGEYDLTVFAQDETDGVSMIKVFIDGVHVETIALDRQSDGGGSNNGTFTEFKIPGLDLEDGSEIKLVAWKDCGEFVRIDKIVLECTEPKDDGEQCVEFEVDADGNALSAGTLVNGALQFDGVVFEAIRAQDTDNVFDDGMIFDSDNPTGGDQDLGVGTGNVLIISEDGDQSDPDDNIGGMIVATLDNPSIMKSLRAVDTEEGGTIELIDANGVTLSTVTIPSIGDGETAVVDLGDVADVKTVKVTLNGSGAIDDFCFIPGDDVVGPMLGSIGDTVFFDTDRDGIQDAGEGGVEGVTVTLTDSGDDGVLGTADDIETVQTTDADGKYLFEDLEGRDYKVTFSDVPDGYGFTSADEGTDEALDSDADPVTGMTDVITLAQGEDNLDVDAGLVELLGSLGDTVFYDTDGNGLQDNGENGVAGVTVTLTGGGVDGIVGTADDTTDVLTTDGDGKYLFEDLEANEYKVTFSNVPAGYLFTTQDAGDDALDSDADRTTGMTDVVTLAAGEDNLTIDAGIVELASLGDRVWKDSNGDGLQDADELGVDGITVNLLTAGDDNIFGTADDVVLDTTTTATVNGVDGFYEFTELDPTVAYQVEFVLPESTPSNDAANPTIGLAFTTQDVDGNVSDGLDSDADTTTGRSQVVTLAPGENNPTIDAGVKDCLVLNEEGLLGVNALLDASRLITFNNDGVTAYDAATNAFTVDATALAQNDPLQIFFPTGRLLIDIEVDENGDLVGGDASDFIVFNDLDGDKIVDAGEEVFLQGQVVGFGADGNTFGGGTGTSAFDVVVEVNGGTLESLYDPLIGVGWVAEQSNFDGWETNFEADSKGNIANIGVDCICA